MAPEGFVTPEKQLLRLIEGHGDKDPAALGAQAIRYRSLSLLSLGAWAGRLSFFKEWLRRDFHGLKEQSLDIKFINKVLLLFIYVLISYFLFDITFSVVHLRKIPDLGIKSPEGVKASNFIENSVLKKAVSFYLEKIGDRNIFKMGAKNTATAAGESAVKAPTAKMMEIVDNLKLVGISWSNDPDALIEDIKALRTSFVKVGGMVGEVKVQAIFKDRVILRYEGEEIELR